MFDLLVTRKVTTNIFNTEHSLMHSSNIFKFHYVWSNLTKISAWVDKKNRTRRDARI